MAPSPFTNPPFPETVDLSAAPSSTTPQVISPSPIPLFQATRRLTLVAAFTIGAAPLLFPIPPSPVTPEPSVAGSTTLATSP